MLDSNKKNIDKNLDKKSSKSNFDFDKKKVDKSRWLEKEKRSKKSLLE